ncbi:putative permease YjgP/YjgQ family protein [Anatilimnocola aggregata]|uniref:Putative permease YjgP/YjgQ family protein n=1 Tax=Anatilimnocola aggregata TaxID=2528021 RepID=A0A517YEG5_9BACT|nr:LptF/LptG family permease [Anatilimnocola aggregata]QDU28624.1 putative permease YjgP/YjgQ family protein [Anatilimnocola aggregata]
MNTLSRSILCDLTKVFAFGLVVLTFIMVLIGIGQQAVQMNLGVGPTLKLIPFALPNALAFAVPGTILFSACFVYGRLAADNEVVAVKSMGISPMVLLAPAIGLSFLLSLVAVWLNDVAYSWGHSGMQRVVIQSVEEITYGLLRTQRSYANPRFSIIVKEVDGRRLIRPIINFQANNDLPAFTLTASEAELRSNLDENTLSLILFDCQMETDDGVRFDWPGRTVQDIPLAFAAAKDVGEGNPAHLPLRKMASAIVDQRQTIVDLEQSVAAEVGLALMTGEFELLEMQNWQKRQSSISNARLRLYRLQSEPWRRWASGFSCLAFVMIGAPLAILWRSSDYLTTFGLCFVPILALYYPLFLAGLDYAKTGVTPPVTVWLGNIVCMIIGIGLIRKVIRN